MTTEIEGRIQQIRAQLEETTSDDDREKLLLLTTEALITDIPDADHGDPAMPHGGGDF